MRDNLLMRTITLFFLLLSVMATAQESPVAPCPNPEKNPRKPCLMPGKVSLYRRVLTHPGVTLAPEPSADKMNTGVMVPAFSRLYVYAEKSVKGTTWLEVGSDDRGTLRGWVPRKQTLPWKQQLTLAFTNPAGRERTLFFEDRKPLAELLSDPAGTQKVEKLHRRLEQGKSAEGVVSIEPKDFIDIQQEFYLLPILDYDALYTHQGRSALLLNVASVTRNEPSKEQNNAADAALLRSFRASIVFVIDSTISMGPYIERTKESVRHIYRNIEEAGLQDMVKFGLIAYRSNVGAVPELEYLARTFVDPAEMKNEKDFLDKVAKLAPAPVSSAEFDEDAYAGIMHTLGAIDWKQFGARYIVLITDAGALESNDGLSATRLGAREVNMEAMHRGIAIYTMHLKTSAGQKNHASAQQQYEVLSQHPLLYHPLYYPIDGGSVDQFGQVVEALSEAIITQMKAAAAGEKVAGSAISAAQEYSSSPIRRIQQETMLLGHAMQLAYFGSRQHTQAPSVFSGWISNIAIEDPDKRPVSVHILLTKKHLSDLYMVLKELVEAANKGLTSPDQFFTSLRSVVSVVGRDPNAATRSEASKIADMGLLGEYLDDLPYKSTVMNLDQDLWSSWSVQQQINFINDLKRKMRLYEIYNSDADRWIALQENSDPADDVYPVPIDALP